MSTPLDIPDRAMKRLQDEARRRGLSVEEIVTELAEALPLTESKTSENVKLSFIGIGRSSDGRSARDTDEILAEGFGQD